MPQPQLHAWSCKSLTAYNFCYEYAKDFYFQVDQKYEIFFTQALSHCCSPNQGLKRNLRETNVDTVVFSLKS